ncbi:tetratricopeptide repeat protein 37 isoform X1 [Alosa sapidissima]|uniref:tetratricopeptide repeat protein 37 isoform X1 n=1 Tax=Alosa sapidissima TaxID=34773 RepID=UPI001C08CA95|nr:tetratricopeptide repeat protein 37 isoform X1 [Alosa sapidissima]
MSSKEVKAALKSAREAIKNKEYKEALKHCKNVLKLEKNNYNAWVFIGVAAGELDQPDQAKAAYKKAAELEPDQLLAWQGLANLYEKNNETDKSELPVVYQKLITLYESSDKVKCQEVSRKLVDLHLQEKDYLQVARVWSRLLQLKEEGEADQAEQLQLWREMAQILQDSVEEQDNETQQHLITAFEKAMTLTESAPCEDHKKLSMDFLTCLSKLPHEEAKLKEVCEMMLSTYPSQKFPLEVLCSHYLKSGACSEEAVGCFRRMLELDAGSGPALLGLGVTALDQKKYEDAIKSLSQGLKQMRSSVVGWYSLAQAQLKIHKYTDSAKACSQGLSCCKDSDTELSQKLQKLKLESLVRSGTETTSDEALDTLTQISDFRNDPVLLSFKGRIYLQKGQIEQALQVSTELGTSHPDSVEAVTLKGLIHQARDELQQAEESFQKALSICPDSGELYFLLGRLYWLMGEEARRDRNKAHTHLLKAAKLDPHLGSVFRYLGHYYREVARDLGRAHGCYKRAFELDGSDGEAGAAAVDISMEQGDMESALAILTSVTERATPGSAKWAWMRRGLYHLKINEHQQAVTDLQAALRADPMDWVCWECLGEAYLHRHSFTTALKAFTKAHLLQPDSIYSLYQMAAIKQILGKSKEAAGEYMKIVQREDYVPALKGLGECLLALARGALEDYLDGRAVDFIQSAIEYLFRGVQQRPDLSCLWKLLGNACSLSGSVAPERAHVMVPGALSGDSPSDQNHRLDQRTLLRLGERCYGQALKLMPEAASLWCDLGINYYRQCQKLLPLNQEQDIQTLLEKSLQCIKKAVMLDSANNSYWNALGVVAMATGVENFALAQHCFIKSVKVEPNNVVAWTNLGVLYLKKENIELAHEAFKVAQSLEPLYVNCWIGQALIAEMVDSADTMDLFRHTTELNTHTEGVKGYAHFVCSTLLDKSNRDSELYRYNILQMNAISAAQVALCKYTERIQTDPTAFVMLGYLNEHLQLKRQATVAYRRAVELLQTSPHVDELSFALRNYGRALCDTGQCEDAVRVYSSTPLGELQDLVGLALAYFRAGHLQESLAAYEKALSVASTEKERAYILTALALLQHRLGSMDTAKTLLFKCSLLKEPISESLLCLCALGLVHGDGTLATAALSELLKLTGGPGGAVEQRCLLTCALLALQGHYSAVPREAARAVHSNPGNATLWALLSRLVPQYHPRQAKGGAVAGSVACLSSMTQGKRALLFSGLSQLAAGRHAGEDRSRNGLKTIQRAVLLCPDDLAAWAGLMAASYAENTACALSGSAPLRQGLERPLMAAIAEKAQAVPVEERPLAHAVESWALQQALSGLRQATHYAQAEALCTQVLSVSPDHPAVLLQLRQLQCERLLVEQAGTALPVPVLEQLSAAVMANPTSVSAWHWLAGLYFSQGLLAQASVAYRQSLQLASQLGHYSGKIGGLLRLALLALTPCMAKHPGSDWKSLVVEATTEALKLGPSPVALLLQALLQFSTKMEARETRRLLERLVYYASPEQPDTVSSVARWYLLRHLHAKDDLELMDKLVEQAAAAGDSRLLEFHKQICLSG